MNANVKPFAMIKNFDIKEDLNINLPTDDIPPNCFAAASNFCNSSIKMLNPNAKVFSLVSTPMKSNKK